VLGEDIHALEGLEIFKLRCRMGMLFQSSALFDSMSVLDNVAFPLAQEGKLERAEIDERARALLAELGLAGSEHLLPIELSGGMRKRVALARATIHQPRIVLYDDPTAGLDPVNSSKIFVLIRRLQEQRGSTDVIVSHDVDRLKRICDRYLLLSGGRVRFLGTLEQAQQRRDDPVVEAFFFGARKAGLLSRLDEPVSRHDGEVRL